MRSENAMMPSRREFLSDALGIGLVTTSTWSIRDGEARSMHGQSDSSAANSGRATKNTSLTWSVLAPSIPAIAPMCLRAKQRGRGTDFVNAEFLESATLSWSTLPLRSSSRAPREVAGGEGKNLTTIYATHGTGIISLEPVQFSSDFQVPFRRAAGSH